MCGIAGIYNLNKKKVKETEIKSMLVEIKHRGPDGNGTIILDNVGLGHTLLKIQDVTNKSRQPFKYNNLILTFNGEIYNYQKLRSELKRKGYIFDSVGDTEVLIKLIDCYGLDKTLKKIEGCYAFAVLNTNTKELYVVRDRFGIKPLYYYIDDGRIIFCSEIKGILRCNKIQKKFNIDKVLESLNCRLWLDSESTFFKNIICLRPGTYLKISSAGIEMQKYYNLKFSNKYNDLELLKKKFSKQFENSVAKKLISKVPVAAFLSGGLDSSIVCKLLSDFSDEKLSTYTICYNHDNDLDLNYANIIANGEKFNKHNILVTEEMYNLDNIDKVTYGVEELLIDKVYIPMFFNYKAAKDDGYTVVVSGQGSDEVWLGYIFTWKIFTYLNEKYDTDYLIRDYYMKNMIFKDKLKKKYKEKTKKVLVKYLNDNLIQNDDQLNSYADMSLKTILHDLLVQEDKIAMMSSVEARVPFVDNHKIVELAYGASSKLKTFDGREKYIVRSYAKDKIDESIVNRKKYPFPEPPKAYNEVITMLCKQNWDSICNSKIIKELINPLFLKSVDNFSEIEQWWLLSYWRFEKVFDMEV